MHLTRKKTMSSGGFGKRTTVGKTAPLSHPTALNQTQGVVTSERGHTADVPKQEKWPYCIFPRF